MDYARKFKDALEAVHREGRYRVFADLKRRRGEFPAAEHFKGRSAQPITVWCSNDYLGMGQHPAVLAAMHEAIDTVGAGSGGTRNISGTTHYHVRARGRARRSARQGGGTPFHLRLRRQRRDAVDARQAASRRA